MKVWLITIGEPLPHLEPEARKLRTAVLADQLEQAGHTVVWWSSRFSHHRKRHYVTKGQRGNGTSRRYVLLEGMAYHSNVSLRRLLNHLQIARDFSRLAPREAPPDLILCSFPTIELSLAAVHYANARGVPVLLDIRDLWPDLFLSPLPDWARPLGRALLHPYFLAARTALRECTAIIGISDQYLNWALKRAGRAATARDGFFPLGYQRAAVPPEEAERAGVALRQLGVDPARKICWFIGSLGKTYDLQPVLAAARRAQSQGNDSLQFVISGQGEKLPALKAEASDLANVVFTGWVETPAIEYLGQNAWVGIQAYTAEAPQGLANKLFEYLSFGLPVLSNLRGENEKFLARWGCGMQFADDEELAAAIRKLSEDEQRHATMKASAREASQAYCADQSYREYVRHLESFAGTPG